MKNKKVSFKKIFKKQIKFQKKVLYKRSHQNVDIPCDNLDWFKYHILAMVEELGEVMKSDKRWKTHRNERYDKQEKIDELADVFITLINILIFSGFNANDILEAVDKKIKENSKRLKE